MNTRQYADTRQYVNTRGHLDTAWYPSVMDTDQASGRLSRDARRAQTRERLLDAAADVFNRLGYHGASLEAVADAAGYTKGAVYSNFASKAELFFALAERRSVAANMDGVSRAFLDVSLAEFIDAMGEMLRAQAARDQEWDVLTIEVWLAAMRDPALRAIVAHDYRQMRDEYGPLIEQKLAEEGITTPFSARELGSLVSALGSGLILQYYLEPEAVDPDLLSRAIRRLVGLPQPEPGPGGGGRA
jgi:AcrR family transcriptional regulator